MTLQRKQSGFTIVELLIVIVVIGILAALVITTFTGIQQRARNTERETDIRAIHSQLEAFFAQQGYYPTRDDLNDADGDVRTEDMRGLSADAFTPPGSSATALAATPSLGATGAYAYAPTGCTGSECEGYTLTADMEGDTPNYTRESLN